MIRLRQIKVKIDKDNLLEKCAKKLKIDVCNIKEYKINKTIYIIYFIIEINFNIYFFVLI